MRCTAAVAASSIGENPANRGNPRRRGPVGMGGRGFTAPEDHPSSVVLLDRIVLRSGVPRRLCLGGVGGAPSPDGTVR